MSKCFRIPRIERRPLPDRLPSPDAIKSFRQSEHHYHPDMWDCEYGSYRYLSGINDTDLEVRYRNIVRNMNAITHADRNIIPIQNYLGTWYWCRKEHQTRLELAMRGFEPPTLSSVSQIAGSTSPMSVKHPNGIEAIFRYGKRQYMLEMLKEGRIRLSPAQSFGDIQNNEARCDDETQKHSYLNRSHTKIVLEDGREVKPLSDVRRSVQGSDYHLVCFSCVWDVELFSDFDSDTCVVVSDPATFSARLKRAGRNVFPGWEFLDCPVQYFDPHSVGKNELFNSCMSKDFRFFHQYEYRFSWSRLSGQAVEGHQFVNIGPAEDIMKIFDKNGREIEF